MSPLATLFVVVVALYLLECVLIVSEDALVLVEVRGGAWRIERRAFALGALRKRIVLLSPFAPQAAVLVVPEWRMARALVGLRDAAVRARAELIERALEDATSGERLRSRIATMRARTVRVRWLSVLLFVHLFAVWPALVYGLGIGAIWPAILTELVVLQFLICWSYVRARRALAAEGGQSTSVVIFALSPPAAARAMTALTRDLARDVHPVSAALHLCRADDALTVAAHARRAARFGRDAEHATPEAKWLAAQWERRLDALLEETVGLASVPNAPTHDGESQSYCPRCWTQYAASSGTCAECSGVSLVSFAPTTVMASASTNRA
jgi:hypothetical protein